MNPKPRKSLRTKAANEIGDVWEEIYDRSTWLGHKTLKNPTDAWLYQEIIFKVKPTFILETGVYKGGSALFLASMLDICQIDGEVCAIEINRELRVPYHPKILWIIGNSTDQKVVKQVISKAEGKKTLVILDSDHSSEHVLKEMQCYWPIVSRGSYLIVEDTWFMPGQGGPYDAVEKFLKQNNNFKIDKTMHRYKTSNNPRGYLKRK